MSLVAYYRVSTKKQGESGLGLEAQRYAAHSYAKTTGQEIVAEFEEVESGKENERPILREAMKRARMTHSTLVVAKMARLSRNNAFLAALMESKVKFITCDNPNANTLTLHFLAAMAEHERKETSERTKAALAAAKARGVKLGAHRKSYLTNKHRLAGSMVSRALRVQRYREYYAPIHERAKALREAGGTLREIAGMLDRDGIRNEAGRPFDADSVKRMLDHFAAKEAVR